MSVDSNVLIFERIREETRGNPLHLGELMAMLQIAMMGKVPYPVLQFPPGKYSCGICAS